jgi:hypothetical protein
VGEVFAGFVCGYIIALVGAPALGLGLPKLRLSSPLVARLMPEGTPVVPLVVVLHGALIILCTGAGLILGMLLLAMKDTGEALGSRNIAFTLLVFGLTLAAAAPVVIVSARFRLQALMAAAVVLALFGWLMPYMAAWSKFGSS